MTDDTMAPLLRVLMLRVLVHDRDGRTLADVGISCDTAVYSAKELDLRPFRKVFPDCSFTIAGLPSDWAVAE